MTPLFKKLNLKDQRAIAVLDAPESFEPEFLALDGITVVRKLGKGSKIGFGIAFAVTRKQLDEASSALVAAADGDAVLWIAYPKGTSRRYKCEFNRDGDWSVLRRAGFDSVRQVAIDEDWSALRFRRVEFIGAPAGAQDRAAPTTSRAKAGPGRPGR